MTHERRSVYFEPQSHNFVILYSFHFRFSVSCTSSLSLGFSREKTTPNIRQQRCRQVCSLGSCLEISRPITLLFNFIWTLLILMSSFETFPERIEVARL